MATLSETRFLLARGLDISAGLGFLRERLGLLGRTVFLLSFGFYLFLLASKVVIGGAPRASPGVKIWSAASWVKSLYLNPSKNPSHGARSSEPTLTS